MDDKIVEPPKKIRKLAIEEPATAVAPPPSVEGNIVRHRSSHHVRSEVTAPPSKIPKLDVVTTPWKGSTSKLCTVTSQQPSASTAHEGEQVSVIIHVTIDDTVHSGYATCPHIIKSRGTVTGGGYDKLIYSDVMLTLLLVG